MANMTTLNFDKLFKDRLLKALNDIHNDCLLAVKNDIDNARVEWLFGFHKQSIGVNTETVIIQPTNNNLKISDISFKIKI